jgi:PncC family amidohydrolase
MATQLPDASKIGALLKARKETVAVAESSAGGLISAALLAIPGASTYFVGGAVVYTREAMRAFAPQSDDVLRGQTPGTEESALARAKLVREHLKTTWGISESGTAGPTGSRYGYPPGHTAIAVSGPRDIARVIHTGSDDRVANMHAFTQAALELLAEAVNASA